jgi:hypothetical protein
MKDMKMPKPRAKAHQIDSLLHSIVSKTIKGKTTKATPESIVKEIA